MSEDLTRDLGRGHSRVLRCAEACLVPSVALCFEGTPLYALALSLVASVSVLPLVSDVVSFLDYFMGS